MKNASTKGSIIAIILLVVFCSCDNNKVSAEVVEKKPAYEQYYYLDVVGDSALDTLVVRSNPEDPGDKDIILLHSGIEDRIVTFECVSAESHTPSVPQIESVGLSANYPDYPVGKSKELRITYRNNDLIPDYQMIDLEMQADSQWMVKRYFLFDTADLSELPYIARHIANELVTEKFGEWRHINFYDDIVKPYFRDFLIQQNEARGLYYIP